MLILFYKDLYIRPCNPMDDILNYYSTVIYIYIYIIYECNGERVEMNISFFGILMRPNGNILIRTVASSEKNMG